MCQLPEFESRSVGVIMQMAGRVARLRTGSMRTLERNELQSALRQARQYTRALVDDLDDGQWRVPRLASVNPVLWEVGHVGWFMEHWCLRWRGAGREPGAPMLVHADRWYDSARVAHDTRWDLDLPSRTDTGKSALHRCLPSTCVANARVSAGGAGTSMRRT